MEERFRAVKVSVIEQDLETKEELADITITMSRTEEDPIGDKLAGKLGMTSEDIGEGLYSFKADQKRLLKERILHNTGKNR